MDPLSAATSLVCVISHTPRAFVGVSGPITVSILAKTAYPACPAFLWYTRCATVCTSLYRNPPHTVRGGVASFNAAMSNGGPNPTNAQAPGGVGKRPGGFFKSAGGGGVGASAGNPAAPARPVEYTMLLHAPLIVENLLPHAGDFELVDQVKGERPKSAVVDDIA